MALTAAMNNSMLNGLQLLLSAINIPAVEILACIEKHDKTATHLSLAVSTDCCLSREICAPPRRLKTVSVASDHL